MARCRSCGVPGDSPTRLQRYDPATGSGTGIVFEPFSAEALVAALDLALDLYAQSSHWTRMVRNGMAEDFSWQRQGGHYVALFDRMLRAPRPAG